MSTLKWWGYLHTNGSIQVKRFFDYRDLDDAHDSPFVSAVCQPFDASGRDEAIQHVAKTLDVSIKEPKP